jgi:leucyl aminopeptidase
MAFSSNNVFKASFQSRRFSTVFVRNAERWQRSIVRDVSEGVTPIEVVSKSRFKEWKAQQPAEVSSWLKATGNTNPKVHSHIFLPVTSSEGQAGSGMNSNVKILFIANDDKAADGDDGGLLSPYAFSSLAEKLPTGKYAFDPPLPTQEITSRAELSWALGAYKFKRYNFKKYEKILDEKKLPIGAVLYSPAAMNLIEAKAKAEAEASDKAAAAAASISDGGDAESILSAKLERRKHEKLMIELEATATATYLVRDMINTPAEDCGPETIEEYVKAVVADVSDEILFCIHR